ncbi:MAG: hypothetical protein ACOCWB_07765 [Bacteroidota bacterium]
MENYIEQLVAEYYKTLGYLVTTNYWIPFSTTRQRTRNDQIQEYESQSWTDIDVLARNENELLIIQVKAIIQQKKVAEKIIEYFKHIDSFLNKGIALDCESDISWWTKDVTVRKILIYDYYSAPRYLDILRNTNVEIIKFTELFEKILCYAENKVGVKEQNATMRFLHFLINEKLITHGNKRYVKLPTLE